MTVEAVRALLELRMFAHKSRKETAVRFMVVLHERFRPAVTPTMLDYAELHMTPPAADRKRVCLGECVFRSSRV